MLQRLQSNAVIACMCVCVSGGVYVLCVCAYVCVALYFKVFALLVLQFT
jgi:hypothetical protein